jgi:uncharacterized protein (DUF2267 family)
MYMKTLPVFAKTEERAMEWVRSLAHDLGSADAERSFQILRSVLHTVRDRLPPNEAVQLGAQLPMLLRGVFYEGWHLAGKPEKYRHREDFLKRIAHDLPQLDQVQLERAVAAVFALLDDKLGGGEVGQVRHSLPEEVRALWPREASA